MVMSGLGALALGVAPLAGGVLLGGLASKPGAPDLRGVIRSELELLERIPEDQVERRAALKRTISEHIDDLLVGLEKRRELQRRTSYFTEKDHWRDLILCLTTVLFTVVAWGVDHHRPLWLELFIAAILLSVLTTTFVVRGFWQHVRQAHHGDHEQRDRDCYP
jgi:hypothetical protein